MDKKEEKEEGAEEGEKGKKGSKKKLIIIIVAVLLLVGIGVGAFLALGGKGKSADGEEGEGEEEVAAEESHEGGGAEGQEGGEGEHGENAVSAPAILPLETFIVNLQERSSFLKATVQLEFVEPELPPTIDSEVPKIRDAIIRVFSAKTAQEVLSADGKEKVRAEVRDEVNDALGSEDVSEVYFTQFIVQ